MADPTKYEPHFNYSGWEAAGSKRPKPGAELDIDFANIARSIDETIDALKDLRRSDGKLKNGIVDKDALDESSRELWESADIAAENAKASAQSAADSAASAGRSAEAARGYASDAVSQGNVPIYASVETVKGLNINPNITAIRTNGYYSPGDGGGALYKRVASEPSHAGKIQSADGAWWELSRTGANYISVSWFGAVGGTDCTQAFQDALDTAAALKISKVTFRVPEDRSFYHISTIRIPTGITLEGDAGNANFQDCQDVDWEAETGDFSCIKAIGPVNTPVIELSRQASVRDFRMVDLRQKRQIAVLDEPWNDTQYAIQLGHDGPWRDAGVVGQTIENVVFVGFTKFVTQYYSGTGSPRSGNNVQLRRLYGMPFEVGVEILFTGDICWARDCQFIDKSLTRSGWITGDVSLFRWNLTRSVTAWKLGRADGFQLFGCQAMFVKYFLWSFKDAYEDDENRGGGFNAVNCPIDVCGVGYRFDRSGGNAIGGSIVGGQIIPNILQPNGEENCAFQFNTKGAGDIAFSFYAANVSIHDGGANSATPVDSAFTGPGSRITPRIVADFTNAEKTKLKLVNVRCGVRSDNLVDIDTAYSNGNGFSAVNCLSRSQNPITMLEAGSDSNAIRLIPSEEGVQAQFAALGSDGTTVAHDIYAAAQRTTATIGIYELRAGALNEGFSAVRLLPNGAFHPRSDAVQNLGQVTRRWSNGFFDRIRPGDGSAIWTSGNGSPEGVVWASPGSLYTDVTGGSGSTLWVKESGTGASGWVAK